MSIHAAGVIGLVLVFVIGTLRPVNLGALALVMTFLLGTIVVGEEVRLMYSGFPVDLLILLTGVTYLFAIAQNNGTVDQIVERATRLARGRRSLIPWVVFLVASLPALAGALGSAGVALLAPIALQLGKRFDLDRRMIGLMVVHGAAAGNFSPLNFFFRLPRMQIAMFKLRYPGSVHRLPSIVAAARGRRKVCYPRATLTNRTNSLCHLKAPCSCRSCGKCWPSATRPS